MGGVKAANAPPFRPGPRHGRLPPLPSSPPFHLGLGRQLFPTPRKLLWAQRSLINPLPRCSPGLPTSTWPLPHQVCKVAGIPQSWPPHPIPGGCSPWAPPRHDPKGFDGFRHLLPITFHWGLVLKSGESTPLSLCWAEGSPYNAAKGTYSAWVLWWHRGRFFLLSPVTTTCNTSSLQSLLGCFSSCSAGQILHRNIKNWANEMIQVLKILGIEKSSCFP